MTKQDIVQRVVQKTGLSRRQASTAVETFLDSITDALKKGDRVCLVGLGSFHLKEKRARRARNPKTNQEVFVPAGKKVVFRPSKHFKDNV